MNTNLEIKVDMKPVVERNFADLALSIVNIYLNQNARLYLSVKQEKNGERNYVFTTNEDAIESYRSNK